MLRWVALPFAFHFLSRPCTLLCIPPQPFFFGVRHPASRIASLQAASLRYLAGGGVAAGYSSTAHCRLFQGTPAMAGTTARWFKGLLQLLACH